MNLIQNLVSSFLEFIDSRAVIRRITLFFTLYMTYHVIESSWEFAVTALALKYDGLSIGGIIAAVTVPIAALQKFAFDAYSDSRKDE
jgi:hypothetical protein